MLVKNNDKVNKWFFYKINGQTKKVNIPGQTSVELPDLISLNQVIRNGYDAKVKFINDTLNRKIAGDFTISSAAGLFDYHLLDTWYASLSVKPTAGLWTDLQNLANGLKADGDWDEMDLMSMVACMETSEQRLRPLKTSSGLDFVSSGSPVFTSEGVQNPTPGAPNFVFTNWNPVTHGVKYTLNNAYIGLYGDSFVSGSQDGNIFSIIDGSDIGTGPYPQVTANVSMRNFGIINSNNGGTSPNIVLSLGGKRYYAASYRQNATQSSNYINGSTSISTASSISVPNLAFILLGINRNNVLEYGTNQIIRSVIIGSGIINSDRVATRLNAFFSSRGITISNY